MSDLSENDNIDVHVDSILSIMVYLLRFFDYERHKNHRFTVKWTKCFFSQQPQIVTQFFRTKKFKNKKIATFVGLDWGKGRGMIYESARSTIR